MGKLRPREGIVLGYIHCAAGNSHKWTVISKLSGSVKHLKSCPSSDIVTWDCEWQQLMLLPSGCLPSGAQPLPQPATSFLNKPQLHASLLQEAFPAKDLTTVCFYFICTFTPNSVICSFISCAFYITKYMSIFVAYQWHPTPVLFPGKSHGWMSLVGCSPWGCEESGTTEWLHFHFSLSCIGKGNGNPLHCSCLENPRDGGAWWAAVYGVSQSRTWLKRLSSSSSKHF